MALLTTSVSKKNEFTLIDDISGRVLGDTDLIFIDTIALRGGLNVLKGPFSMKSRHPRSRASTAIAVKAENADKEEYKN